MPRFQGLLLVLASAAFGFMLLGRLEAPLLWQDEGETAMFASRVVDHGYPKVHGAKNVVYEFGPNIALGVKESVDAYIGKTWGDFYFAAPAVVWARATDDPAAQAFRLRLPFALVGAAGLAILWVGVLPAVPLRQRWAFAATFVALCAVSISLLLHLREVRYYALLLLALATLLTLHLRDERASETGWKARAVGQALASLALFHVFHVAWFAATALLATDRLVRAWPGDAATRSGRLARAAVPHLLAVALVAPALVFFETFQVAGGFASDVGITPAGYLANLGWVLAHFARHEWLVPAVLCAVAAAAALRGRSSPAHVLGLRLRSSPRPTARRPA